MKKQIILTAIATVAAIASAQDYKNGVFVLNEDWYGHNNSTLNIWHPDDKTADYLIVQTENPGQQLGATAQYGQIFGGKLYVVSKQDIDPGVSESSVESGRFVVLDASTMKVETIIKKIAENADGNSIADGRACCGVDESKVYIGTTNGIYIYHTDDTSITGPIAGTENELITGDENNADGQGPLYQNQIGMMIRGQDYIFAIKQDKGILVINPTTDTIVNTIEGCFSTMVLAHDGNIWAGMNIAEGTNAYGVSYQHYPYGDTSGEAWDGSRLMCIDQYSLATRTVDLSVGGVPQSWYAWTAGTLSAAANTNMLYFTYSDPSLGAMSWFSNTMLYRFDIDNEACDNIYNSADDDIYFYSSSLRVNPRDDKLYAHFYIGSNIASQSWLYMVLDSDGNEELTFQPIKRYWYPAMYIFPDIDAPQLSDMPSQIEVSDEAVTIDLSSKVSDADTPSASIVKRVASNTNPEVVKAEIVRGQLVLTALATGNADVTVKFDSNGQIVTHTITVNATNNSAIDGVTVDEDDVISTQIYTPMGLLVRSVNATLSDAVAELPAGLYIVSRGGKVTKIHIK